VCCSVVVPVCCSRLSFTFIFFLSSLKRLGCFLSGLLLSHNLWFLGAHKLFISDAFPVLCWSSTLGPLCAPPFETICGDKGYASGAFPLALRSSFGSRTVRGVQERDSSDCWWVQMEFGDQGPIRVHTVGPFLFFGAMRVHRALAVVNCHAMMFSQRKSILWRFDTFETVFLFY